MYNQEKVKIARLDNTHIFVVDKWGGQTERQVDRSVTDRQTGRLG